MPISVGNRESHRDFLPPVGVMSSHLALGTGHLKAISEAGSSGGHGKVHAGITHAKGSQLQRVTDEEHLSSNLD
jgi:hypothetical protein